MMESEVAGKALPYREALRALGWRLDARGLIDLRLDARGDDLVIAAYPVAQPGHVERASLAPSTVPVPPRADQRQRDSADAALAPPAHPIGLGYQEVLRVLGQELDRRGIRLARVIEHDDGLIVQSLPSDAPGAPLTTELLRWETLQAQHDRALRRRGTAGARPAPVDPSRAATPECPLLP